jgi:hypothetical protein
MASEVTMSLTTIMPGYVYVFMEGHCATVSVNQCVHSIYIGISNGET